MACPLCGDVCRCVPEPRAAKTRPRFHPQFEPDPQVGRSGRTEAVLMDLEADDLNEQPFEASPDAGQAAAAQARFVVDSSATSYSHDDEPKSSSARSPNSEDHLSHSASEGNEAPHPQAPQSYDSASWRREIAARVDRYRSRRRSRGPCYPSLRLKFEAGEPMNPTRTCATPNATSGASRQAARQAALAEHADAPAEASQDKNFRETTAKIIAFPRSTAAPVRLDELAEPVIDRPRILEAPEVAPPPPALGGILIEPVQEKETEKRPGFDVPLQSAALERRVLACAIDVAIVLAASMLFGYLFFKITALTPPLSLSLGAMTVVSGVFWTAYEYLLLVYTGSTPGLKAAKLQLSRFDGTPASRSLRRWRVLASLLSAISVGMGYAWCFLDEDALCWHDRITHTYLGPRAASEVGDN